MTQSEASATPGVLDRDTPTTSSTLRTCEAKQHVTDQEVCPQGKAQATELLSRGAKPYADDIGSMTVECGR
jgi:hypothetical protein